MKTRTEKSNALKTWTIKYTAPITIVVEARTESAALNKAQKQALRVANNKTKIFIGEPQESINLNCENE